MSKEHKQCVKWMVEKDHVLRSEDDEDYDGDQKAIDAYNTFVKLIVCTGQLRCRGKFNEA